MSLIVWHGGGCPLCRREIALMRRLDGRRVITFVDARTGNCPINRDDMMAGLYADENGRMLSGAAPSPPCGARSRCSVRLA